MLKKRTKFNKGYATVVEDDGVNYREISEIMTEMGFVMNHSSARNYVLRVMNKFAEAFDKQLNLGLSDERVRNVACSPQFQSAIADLLHSIEVTKEDN